MPNYWICVYRPEGCDPAELLTAEDRLAIDQLNDDMEAAGVRVFAGGLRSVELARTVRAREDGSFEEQPGSALATGGYLDGFWIISVESEEAALAWARRAALACRAQIEVRAFH